MSQNIEKWLSDFNEETEWGHQGAWYDSKEKNGCFFIENEDQVSFEDAEFFLNYILKSINAASFDKKDAVIDEDREFFEEAKKEIEGFLENKKKPGDRIGDLNLYINPKRKTRNQRNR